VDRDDVAVDDVAVRERRPADLDDCVRVLRLTHEADSYPLNWPADPHRWLTPPGLLCAWVAERPRGVIAGHVALDGVGDCEAELSRLFVSPAARRRSVARLLLDRAVAWASARRLRLKLNVVDERRSAAVAFYEAAGWQYTHSSVAGWVTPAGESVTLRHYALPEPDAAV
jgi:GNAT superfamily N-acetyltransferase